MYDPGRIWTNARTVYEFDDRITAPFFGFGTADNYYATQSSNQYLDRIRIPTLLIQAKDDPLIPFKIYDHPGIRSERDHSIGVPWSTADISGFLSNGAPRFWVDRAILRWLEEIRNKQSMRILVFIRSLDDFAGRPSTESR